MHAPYQHLSQRHQIPDSSRQQFTSIPPPPPLPVPSTSQPHTILLPPPPPRLAHSQAYAGHVPPPPSTLPGPGSAWHSSYSRQPNSMSPPPLLSGQHAAYNPNAYHNFHSPLASNAQPSPQDEQPLTSARYIPTGESFGPGVGIPPLNPGLPHLYPQNRLQQDNFASAYRHQVRSSSSQAGSLRSQRSVGHRRGHSQSREELDLYNAENPTFVAPDQARDVVRNTASYQMGVAAPISSRFEQDSPELPTPISSHDPGTQWPMERVLSWLDENQFSAEWRDTFRKLNIYGLKFLDISSGHGGKGNYNTLHTLVYPQLQKEVEQKTQVYDPSRQQEEGRRLRKLLRKLAENGGSAGSRLGPRRRDSAPWYTNAEQSISDANTSQRYDGPQLTPTVDGEVASPGNSATEGFLSPRPPSGLSHRQMGTSKSPVVFSAVDPLVHEISVPDPLTVVANRSGLEVTSKAYAPLEGRDTSLRPDSTRQVFDTSPQLSPLIGHSKPPTANATMTGVTSNQGRYYGHRRNLSSESNGSYGLPAPSDSKKRYLTSFFSRRTTKKDDSFPSPEEIGAPSPSSPVNFRQNILARAGDNVSEVSTERQTPRSPMIETDRKDSIVSGGWLPHTKTDTAVKFVLISPDSFNFRLVNVSGIDSAKTFRHLVSQQLMLSDAIDMSIYVTVPGQHEHYEALQDDSIVELLHQTDSSATVKFFVRTLTPTIYSSTLKTSLAEKQEPLLFAHNSTGNIQSSEGSFPAKNTSRLSSNDPMQLQGELVSGGNGIPFSGDIIVEKNHLAETLTEGSPDLLSKSSDIDNIARPLSATDGLDRTRRKRPQGVDSRSAGGSQVEAQAMFSGPVRREGVIDFDVRRKTPFEPLRSPPPVPPDSTTLIKANSLSKRNGAPKRLSHLERSESSLKIKAEDDRRNSIKDKARAKRISDSSTGNSGSGVAMAGTGKSNSNLIGPLTLTTRNSKGSLSFHGVGESGREFHRAMACVNFEPSKSSPGGSPPGFTMSKGNIPFKIPEYDEEKISDIMPGTEFLSPVPRPRIASTPRDKHLDISIKSPDISPSSAQPPSSLSRSSTKKGYITDFAETPVKFNEPESADKQESDEDSDDGLFAVPLASASSQVASSRCSGDSDNKIAKHVSVSDRSLHDESQQGKKRDNVVTFQSPQDFTKPLDDFQDFVEADDENRFMEDIQADYSAAPTSRNSSGSDPSWRGRRQSFASDIWAHRPPAEALVEHLDDFFPNVDLDQPMLEERVDAQAVSADQHLLNIDSLQNSPDRVRVSPIESHEDQDVAGFDLPITNRASANKALAQRNMKRLGRTRSIREVVKDAYQHPARNPSVSLNRVNTLQSGNILRRKSTKMFGARIEQIKPPRGSRLIQLETIPQDSIPQDVLTTIPQRQPTFKWMKGELIGKGTFGRVYLGMNTTTGELIAVKQVEVKPKQARQDKDKIKEMVKALDQEIDTMQHLDHPNIVQYLGCERKEYSISIFLEYISGGSIGSCLRKHGKFEESVVSSLTRQTLDGLAYLHNASILHRDLKADNILLDLDGTCKISDFGISKKSDNIYGNDVTNSMQGSVFWMAPEVVRSHGHGYSAKVDIWSLGCVVLEMFAGRRPWSGEEVVRAIFKLGSLNQAPPIPDEVLTTISPAASSFMYDCFELDPGQRPTAETLLRSSFTKVDPHFNFLDTELYSKIRPNF